MARHKDANWMLGEKTSMEGARLAVLMDIRDELKQLNRLVTRILDCPHVQFMFAHVEETARHTRKIARNTARRRRAKKKEAPR